MNAVVSLNSERDHIISLLGLIVLVLYCITKNKKNIYIYIKKNPTILLCRYQRNKKENMKTNKRRPMPSAFVSSFLH